MFSRFFKKDQSELVNDYFGDLNSLINSKEVNWLALAINDRMIKESLLTKELVVYSKDNKIKHTHAIQLADNSKGVYTKLLKGNKVILEDEISDVKKIKKEFKTVVENYFLTEFEHFKTMMNKGDFSPLQLENEEKALEWIRVSFEVLKKGIIESITNPDFLFQAKIFAGTNPQTNEREIRIINFNLDITLILLTNNNLRVIIYNRKPGISDKDLKPSLIGDYSFRKREIFDHIIDLFSLIIKPVEA